MVCPECNNDNKKFDERMGELVCQDCGLVLVTEPFEQTVSALNHNQTDWNHSAETKLGGLGTAYTRGINSTANVSKDLWKGIPTHILKGVHFCNMALNAVAPQMELHDRVAKLYVECNNKALFTSHALEDRASAVVFYALKENNTPFTMKEVCAEYSSNPKHVRSIVRRINQAYGNRNCFSTNHEFSLSKEATKFNAGLEFENTCNKVLAKMESNMDELHFSRGKAYYAVICWYASLLLPNLSLTQKEIAEKTGFTAQTIKKKGTELCVLLGFKNTDEMKGKITEV